MVNAYAYGGAVLTANIQERDKAFAYALNLLCVFLIGVFQLFERTCRIHVVARVDAHLLHITGGHIGHGGVEVDIGHERGVVAAGIEAFTYQPHVFRLACALSCHTNQFSAGLNDTYGLLNAALCIHGCGGGHGLQAYGIASAYGGTAHTYADGFAAVVYGHYQLVLKLYFT